jgi:hypothetical protein
MKLTPLKTFTIQISNPIKVTGCVFDSLVEVHTLAIIKIRSEIRFFGTHSVMSPFFLLQPFMKPVKYRTTYGLIAMEFVSFK